MSELRVVPEEPWYSEGLRFACTGCGQCCTGAPGYTWVTEEECGRMAEYLGMELKKFVDKYVRRVHGRLSLKEDRKKDYDCIFLKGKKCEIYEVRPKQCRTFPWWPSNLSSEESWKSTAERCEGICRDAPVVPYETIKEQLTIQIAED